MTWHYEIMGSPIGDIHLIAEGEALCALEFEGYEKRMRQFLKRRFGRVEIEAGPVPAATRDSVEAYFAGDFSALDRIPTKTGGTEFQERVWQALRAIPCGETTTYGAIAKRIGAPGASRAVGLANGSNSIALVIPCHRVIGADGSLTGFGGGLERKQWLLAHEGVAPQGQGELGL